MRRLLLALSVPLLLAALPAAAVEEAPAEALEPCTVEEGTTVITFDGLEFGIATPLPQFPEETDFVVDLSGGDGSELADMTLDLTWGDTLNDFDLRVYDGGAEPIAESLEFNQLDGVYESVFFEVEHCRTYTARASNFAGSPLETLTLTAAVTPF